MVPIALCRNGSLKDLSVILLGEDKLQSKSDSVIPSL